MSVLKIDAQDLKVGDMVLVNEELWSVRDISPFPFNNDKNKYGLFSRRRGYRKEALWHVKAQVAKISLP